VNTGNIVFDRQLARWYDLIPHPVQLELIKAVENGVRFPLVPAGRRSGKTERFKRFLVHEANRVPGQYYAAAPTFTQAKKIFWKDLKDFSLSCTHQRRPSESELQIFMPNGSEIHVLGMDKPERFEGVPWKGGGIDEFGDIKANAWQENIYPALNTYNPNDPDYRPWCWCLGVPAGINHYSDLVDMAKSGMDKDFKIFHWLSKDILPPDVIESAKTVLSAKQFRQEFEGSFETPSGRIYEDYSADNHTTETIQPHEQLCWFHDFNYTPLSSGIGVIRDDKIYILDEIILTSAVSRQSAMEFVDKFQDHANKNVVIYGDPSGKAGEKHGHVSDYIEIEDYLRSHGWEYLRKVKPSIRSIKDGQNAVRGKIKNARGEVSLYVNPAKAPYAHKSLADGQLKEGSTFLEADGEYQHIGTAIRYFIDYEWPTNGLLNFQVIR
jgi:hypothetical protein